MMMHGKHIVITGLDPVIHVLLSLY